jgi:tetratricopeptide (TPR) repeat protein
MRRGTMGGRGMRTALALLAMVLPAWGAPPLAAQQTAADSAWEANDVERAGRLYEARLAADSTDARALHRLALIRAWAGRHDESLALFDRFLRLHPGAQEARLDRARVLAWKGDYPRALNEIEQLLAERPGERSLVEARAQWSSWAGRYDESLSAYGELMRISPGDRSVRQAEARVLGWAARYPQAIAAYGELLRANPDDRDALLGLAQVLSWSARYDSARAVFARMLARDPADMDALRGLARVASWNGELREGEAAWRRALAVRGDDVASLAGLGATLRWQGRDASALEVLRRAQALAPEDPDVREQLRYAEAAVAPRAAPAFTHERDSDGNRISTTTFAASAHLTPRVQARGSGYLRAAGVETGADREARGALLTLSALLEPGWVLTGGVGASGSDVEGNEAVLAARAGVQTPGWWRVRGGVSFARSALDATAALVERGVVTEEVSAAATATLSRRWTLSGGALSAAYHGSERNTQAAGNLGVAFRAARPLTLGVAARAFSFAEDLDDGYFDPDFYGVVEATGAWSRELGKVSLGVEAAPGVQQVGSDGDVSSTWRAAARAAYVVGPGRQVGVSGAWSESGLQALSPGAGAGYRYRAFSVFGSWTF